MNMPDKNDADVLLEDMNSKFDAIMEAVGGLQDQVKKIPKMSERLEKIEYDISSIKLDASMTRSDVKTIKIRSEKLEDIKDDVNDLQKRIHILEST